MKKIKFNSNSDLTVAEYNYLEKEVLNAYDPYEAYISYLKEKHGKCHNNYFANKDCLSKTLSFNGMHRHHDYEDTVASLSDNGVAAVNPWEYQLAENLTYCLPAEHALIHILIAEKGELGVYGAMKIMNTNFIEANLKKILEDRLNASATVFTWNQAVVVEAVEQLKTYKLCYMNIATGAGKSSSAQEVAKAVNRDFIVVSPANKINESWENHNKNNPHFKGAYSYTKFMHDYETLVKDGMLIIADEAHHLCEKGKGKWGEAVINAAEIKQDIMVLGLSASKFRAKNKRKADQTMEEVWHRVFKGHVAHGIEDIAEGIEKGIFAPITYVCACYDKKAINDLISLTMTGTATTKSKTLQGKLDLLKNETQIASLLNKYQPEKVIRDLVFIEHTEDTEVADMINGTIEKINDFEQAKKAIMAARPELTDDNFRIVHSKQPKTVNDKNFEWFEEDAEDARYLVSIGMVKEGYHPDILTGEIIFRRVGAGTVYEQILGRAAVLKNKAKHDIVVFDFVDAIKSAKFKFEASATGTKGGKHSEIIQKLSSLTAQGAQVIDYTSKLDALRQEVNSYTCYPIFTAEELL